MPSRSVLVGETFGLGAKSHFCENAMAFEAAVQQKTNAIWLEQMASAIVSDIHANLIQNQATER